MYCGQPIIHIPSKIPHMDTFEGYFKNLQNITFTPEVTNKIISQEITPEVETDKEFDLVYIVKQNEENPDLKFSLRSICKFCTFRKIWIIGYKPTWLKDVEYIHPDQTEDKWKNSVLNYITACNTKGISDNFILMNDDFFALHPIRDWKRETNKCLGLLAEKVASFGSNKQLSRWQSAFIFARELLRNLDCKLEYDYEAHIPFLINKQNFLNMLKIKEIQDFMQSEKVLHKRSIYKNLYPESALPEIIEDVKLELQEDFSDKRVKDNWLSVYDHMVNNCRVYPVLNKLLLTLFPNKCRYEV